MRPYQGRHNDCNRSGVEVNHPGSSADERRHLEPIKESQTEPRFHIRRQRGITASLGSAR